MSCVAYWGQCEKCNHEEYDRNHTTVCPKCGSTEINNIREWDEEGDHPGTHGYWDEDFQKEEDEE